jgi:tripartite ATP-independent transporter DctM subunit
MTEPQVAVLMLVILILAIFLGFPVAFTLMALGVAFGYYAYFDADRMWRSYERAVEGGADAFTQWETWIGGIFNNRIFDLFVNQTYGVMSNDVLTAIPLFLFMGYIVERANIVDRLFSTLFIAMRRLPGSMAVAALLTCTLFATATGIVGAVVTLMGLLAMPAMMKAKYDVRYSSGVICAGGTLGILIPPSILLIVYAATSGVSVVRMYAAALLPGLMLAGLYLVYVIGRAVLNPALAPRPKVEDVGEHSTGQLAWMLLTSFVPLAFLILSVLGAILFGIATPSEAAAVGAAGGLVLAVAYRALTWQRLKESVYLTARASAMVCWLFVGSATFASIFAYLGGQQLVSDFVTGLDMSPLTFLIVAQLIIFVLGWPLEWTEIIVIFIPIFLPLLPHFGIDPLFFGVLVAVNLQTAFLSPPMAMSAYYLKGVSPPGVELPDIFRGMLPYMFIVIFCMVLLYLFPQIVYGLPNAIYGAPR